MIAAIASVKKRPIPDSPSHTSVGTDATRAKRAAQPAPAAAFTLSIADLERLVLNEATMRLYGFPVDIPPGVGATNPHSEGEEMECDRCSGMVILRRGEGQGDCQYHWGRPIKSMGGGE